MKGCRSRVLLWGRSMFMTHSRMFPRRIMATLIIYTTREYLSMVYHGSSIVVVYIIKYLIDWGQRGDCS